MSPSALRRQIGQLLIAGFDGQQIPVELRVARARVRAGRRDPVRAQHRRARSRSPSWRSTRRGCVPELPALGERRSGRRPRRAAEGAVHRMAADGDARPQRRRDAGGAVRARAGGGAEGRRHHARLRAGARHPHQPEEPGDRRSRAGGEGGGRRAARRRDRPRAAGRGHRRLRQAFSRVTATPAPIRISSCRWSSIRPSGCARRVRAVPGGDRGRRGDHHDGARARAVARRAAAGHAVAPHRHGPAARRAATTRA